MHKNTNKKKFSWTSVFLMVLKTKKDSDLVSHQIEMAAFYSFIDELLDSDTSGNTGTLICLTTSINQVQQVIPDHIFEDPDRDAYTTLFLKLVYDEKKEKNQIKFIAEKKKFDITSEADIIGFFGEHILKDFMAEKYILFTWDHGNSYGIFRKDEKVVKNNNKLSDLLYSTKIRELCLLALRLPITDEQKKVCSELLQISDQPLHMLTMKELANAIQLALGKRVEIIVMANCFMQIFDTAYELRDSTRFLIAPQTDIYMFAYNYKAILDLLNREPHVSTKKVAATIINSYPKKNIRDQRLRRRAMKEITFSALNLKHCRSLALVINSISRLLLANLETEFEIMKCCRKDMKYMGTANALNLIDPYHFINCYAAKTQDAFFKDLAELFNHIHSLFVSNIFIGSDYEDPYNKIKPHGFTLFFPAYRNDVNSAWELLSFVTEHTREATRFNNDTNWDRFIQAYIKKAGLSGDDPNP